MKILVNIYVPAISEKYDILIPDTLRIQTAITMIAGTVESLSNYLYVASGSECLCYVEKGIRLRSNSTLAKYGIQNGDHLILV